MSFSPILSPAYALEHYAYNDSIKNPVLKEIIPRVAALAAPILYALQHLAYSSVCIGDLVLALLHISPGITFQYALFHSSTSFKNLFSSIFEIPEKLLFGAHHRPNYFGDSDRYIRKDLNERIDLI